MNGQTHSQTRFDSLISVWECDASITTAILPMQVRLLAHNLNEILSNTMKLQQYEDVSSSNGMYHCVSYLSYR